ncbi:MAG: hypothetical protein RTU63_07190 [Candidatus Thorarchaeota archaeon]
MSHDEDPHRELSGPRLRVVRVFMIIVWLIVSLGVFPMIAGFVMIGKESTSVQHFMEYVSFFSHPMVIGPLTCPSLLYIWQMVRYYRGDSTRYNTIMVGLLSVLLPTLYLILVGGMLSPIETLLVMCPLCLTIIVGLILMFRLPYVEMISPW